MTNSKKGLRLSVTSATAAAGFLTFYKLAGSRGGASDATLVMLTVAAVLNSIVSRLQQRGRPPASFDKLSILLALALAVFTLLGNECAAGAVQRISAPLTSVMQQTQVLFVALLGRALLDERVSLRFWIGTTIAATGLLLLHLSPGQALHVDEMGMLMAVGSAACFGFMAVLTRRYIHRIRPVAVNALRLWMSVVMWFLVHRRLPALPMSASFVAFCALAGAFGPFISRTALMYALSYIPPTRTTLVGLLTPVITLLPAFVAFGTVPTARELLGSAIMIAGIALPVLERASVQGQAESAPAEG